MFKNDVNQITHDDIIGDQKDNIIDVMILYLEQKMPIFLYTSAKQNEGIDYILQHLIDIATSCRVWNIDPKLKATITMKDHVMKDEIACEKYIAVYIRKCYIILHNKIKCFK